MALKKPDYMDAATFTRALLDNWAKLSVTSQHSKFDKVETIYDNNWSGAGGYTWKDLLIKDFRNKVIRADSDIVDIMNLYPHH